MGGNLVNIEGKASLIGSITNHIQLIFGGGGSKLPKDAKLLIQRFQQLLTGHKLNRAQLLRLVPKDWNWNLGSVSDDQSLLQSLTVERIAWLAAQFGVREEWLAGNGDDIYLWPRGYKRPQTFAATLAGMGWLGEDLRMTILAANYRRGTNGALGQFTIVFSYPLAEWDRGEVTIYRHLNFDTGMMSWLLRGGENRPVVGR